MERIKLIPGNRTGTNRPIVLSIAGMDPSSGAGLLSDIKTFEQLEVYGLGVNTGNTIQTDLHFFRVKWTSLDFIRQSVQVLADRFEIAAIKIGVLPSINQLRQLLRELKESCPQAKILWDPVFRSSTDFPFMDPANWGAKECAQLKRILRQMTLLTPNLSEAAALANAFNLDMNTSMIESSRSLVASVGECLSVYCPVLIKGGHGLVARGTDLLYMAGVHADTNAEAEGWTPSGHRKFLKMEIVPESVLGIAEKHGSGCVLSAAITAQLAKGRSLLNACKEAKAYTAVFLSSNHTLLGVHVQ